MCGCGASVTTVCLCRATTWTERQAGLQAMWCTRFTRVPVLRCLT
ncbi:hypothetical protein E2C01_064135 [Portunus trituberculatus]|uniref:Uncharacterized protein n=1 Tax=Portunus trituberculatus TaxID=210409 RepID=A0A5B7HFG6_PORTR|nr:hypothetical protein [Portunus trituberculatus]